MKILLFGANGQVGWRLRHSLSGLGEVVALGRTSGPLCGDLLDAEGVADSVASVAADVVVNAAAFVEVDRAEDEPDLAFAVNAAACDALARATARQGAWLLHYSSDYVYDGSGDDPWRETDAPHPLNAYGRSKLAGDEAILRGTPRHLLLRTSWVFDSRRRNFAKGILEAATTRDGLRVVADQWGAPTTAALVADVTAHVLRSIAHSGEPERLAGLYHLAAAGFTDRLGYARLLLEEAERCGWPLRTTPDNLEAVAPADHPTRATRPRNSRLDTTRLRDTFGIDLPPWQDGVRAVVEALARQRACST